MTAAELNERLALRLEWVAQNGATYTGPGGELGLVVGDQIFSKGRLPGWTMREFSITLCDQLTPGRMLEYWLCEMSGADNPLKQKFEADRAARWAKEEAKRKRVVAKYGPPVAYQAKTFHNFEALAPGLAEACRVAEDWAYGCDPGNLVLAGNVGTGKTHLASAALDVVSEFDEGVLFVRAVDLLRHFRERVASESELLARYGDAKANPTDELDYGCRLLVIDDFGLGAADAYATDIFVQILDRRNCQNLRTVITTNATQDEIKAWLGERGYSRLMYGCTWVAVTGPDYRMAGGMP